jgi:ATP-dependent Clp protease ATP-binding subunit ClpA
MFSEGVPSGVTFREPMDNLTPRAHQVLAHARVEADRLHHHFVGTEHLLLGLIKLGQGTAVNVLGRLGLDLETVRTEVERQVGPGPDEKQTGMIPYTPRVKKVLVLAAKEARALRHTYVGTEHILLGILREGDGVAGRLLSSLEVNAEQARQEVLRELDPNYACSDDEAKPPLESRGSTTSNRDEIDTGKRYDVYCAERNQKVVVYRNALFKGVKKPFPHNQFLPDAFVELEQANGQSVFVSRYSIVKFCPHGTIPDAESVPPQSP